MGAWGAAVFQNDDAVDFSFELNEAEAAGWKLVRRTLRQCLQAEGYQDATQSAMALAAAEAVAAAKGCPGPGLPDDIVAWVREHGADLPAGLEDLAREAVEKVLDDEESELRQLWADEGDPAWKAALDDLIARLSA